MSLLLYKSIAGILILLTSLLSVIYPLRRRAHPHHHPFLESADAFASGIFLGAALFHLLPAAIHQFSLLGHDHYPLAELFCASAFLILLFLERLSQRYFFIFSAPYIIAIILIIHSLIEGAALGANTTLSTAAIIFIAIIAHKSSESFALAVTLNRSTITFKRIVLLVGIFSVMTPIGIVLGTTLTFFLQMKAIQALAAGFNAFAAGTFLYMSTLHHLNHHHHAKDIETLNEFWFLLSGLLVMAMLAVWV